MMSSFGIPDDVVMSYTDDVVLESPNNHYKSYQPGAVLEFADFKRFLVADGRERRRVPVRLAGVPADPRRRRRHRGRSVQRRRGGVRRGGRRRHRSRGTDRERARRGRSRTQKSGDRYRVRDGGRRDEPPGVRRSTAVDDAPTRPRHRARRLLVDLRNRRGHREGRDLLHPERPPPRVRTGEPDRRRLPRRVDRPRPPLRRRDEDQRKVHRGSAHIQMPDQMHTDRFLAIGDTVPSIDPSGARGSTRG